MVIDLKDVQLEITDRAIYIRQAGATVLRIGALYPIHIKEITSGSKLPWIDVIVKGGGDMFVSVPKEN